MNTTTYDRRKARRLIQEGEVARAALIAGDNAFAEENRAHHERVFRLHHIVGTSSVDLDDLARLSDRDLAEVGIKRATVLRVIESREDLEELRRRTEAARLVHKPKQQLGARVAAYIQDHFGSRV